jgi:hypothetical protein
MANFKCFECNIFLTTFHQRDGHLQLVHQSTCHIHMLLVELLLIDQLTTNFIAPLIDAQGHLDAVITSNPISKCTICSKTIQP